VIFLNPVLAGLRQSLKIAKWMLFSMPSYTIYTKVSNYLPQSKKNQKNALSLPENKDNSWRATNLTPNIIYKK